MTVVVDVAVEGTMANIAFTYITPLISLVAIELLEVAAIIPRHAKNICTRYSVSRTISGISG